MTQAETPSNESLLRTIIETQVRGGYDKWSFLPQGGAFVEGRIHALEIILDTQGCKAAYGEERENVMWGIAPAMNVPRWETAAMKVHWAWHSGEGNNVRAALEIAVSFLPKK